ncbi:MAG: rhomboid family intramembrane serine protease [Proteobacteria bacterium]|nr:MAG: rhomboid family intramembrane serine protease [Pseudomonadota bacterium]
MPIRLSPTVKIIAIICVAVFLLQHTLERFAGVPFSMIFGLSPWDFLMGYKFWQIFTYPFLHADALHLFFNLLMIAFIGSDIEWQWGRKKFLSVLFAGSITAGFLYLILQAVISSGLSVRTPLIGISGSVYAMLAVYGMLFGERVMLFMMLFPLKAKHFIWVLAGMELMTSLFSGRGGLSSAAHLGGFAAGWAFVYLEKRMRNRASILPFGNRSIGNRKPKKTPQHLKLVVNKDPDSDEDSKPKTWH